MTLAGAATGRNASSTCTCRQRSFEIVDIALQSRLPGIGDRPDANGVGRGGKALARIELSIELGEPLPIGSARERIGACCDRPPLEAAEPFENVLRPADGFPELAVADDVDAGIGLPANDLGDGIRSGIHHRLLVERLAGLLRAQEILQSLRPDQAADMGGQNAVGTSFHLLIVARG